VPNLGTVGPYRFFWLEPIELADSKRFAAHELREIEEIVQDRHSDFLEAWNEHFGS
jgi:uncharacterized protein DUF4160